LILWKPAYGLIAKSLPSLKTKLRQLPVQNTILNLSRPVGNYCEKSIRFQIIEPGKVAAIFLQTAYITVSESEEDEAKVKTTIIILYYTNSMYSSFNNKTISL